MSSHAMARDSDIICNTPSQNAGPSPARPNSANRLRRKKAKTLSRSTSQAPQRYTVRRGRPVLAAH